MRQSSSRTTTRAGRSCSAARRRGSGACSAAGYRLTIREPEWFEHRLFKGPDTNINLHVFTAGTPEIARMLRFRDWLRAHDDDRDYYAAAKRGLAGREWLHVQHYAEAKTAVVQEIMARADAAAR